jgi:hypothetical protein
VDRVRRWFSGRRTAGAPPAGQAILIVVTEEDIRKGKRGDSSGNPVALAINREVDVAQARVGHSSATLVRGWEPLDVQVVSLPQVARIFLGCYEAHLPVSSFTFTLVIEAPPQPGTETVGFEHPGLGLGLPQTTQVAVQHVHHSAVVLLARAGEFPPGSRDLYLVEQVRDRYVREALDEYHALTDEQRRGPITPDGRTGLQVLQHELDLMDARLEAIARDLEARRADAAMANERFLDDQLRGPET